MTEAIWQRYSPFREDAKLSVVLSSAYGFGHTKTLALPSLALHMIAFPSWNHQPCSEVCELCMEQSKCKGILRKAARHLPRTAMPCFR